MSFITPELSKRVGWDKPLNLTYPKASEVVTASDVQILTWHRFLPTPENWSQEKAMKFINGIVSGRYIHTSTGWKVKKD